MEIWFIIAICAIIVVIDTFGLFVHKYREMGSNVVVSAEDELIAICAIIVQLDASGLFCINSMECAQMWL